MSSLSIAAALIIGALFCLWGPRASLAQNYASYELKVFCGNRPQPEQFWYNVKGDDNSMGVSPARCAGNCGGRMVTLTEALAGLPEKVKTGLTSKVEEYERNAVAGKASSIANCIGMGKDAKGPGSKCKPPSTLPSSPWFDRDQTCGQWQRGVVSWNHLLAADGSPTADIAYTVKICGESINFALKNGAGPKVLLKEGEFKFLDQYGWERKSPGARGFDVCCESWLKAANSRSPCDARRDIDCDEAVNEIDRFPEIPQDRRQGSDFFVMKAPSWPADAGYQLDPPWNYLHAPDQSECKGCKWELIKYEFTTREIPDRIRSDHWGMPIVNTEYSFKTLWKCPVTGQTRENYEVVTKQPLSPGPADGSTPPG